VETDTVLSIIIQAFSLQSFCVYYWSEEYCINFKLYKSRIK